MMMRLIAYADEMSFGTVFPAITVFYDGVKYWLADGFHCFLTAQQNETETILTDAH